MRKEELHQAVDGAIKICDTHCKFQRHNLCSTAQLRRFCDEHHNIQGQGVG